MSRLAQLWRRWVELTSLTETGETLALFRMGVGIAVIWPVTLARWSGASEIAWRDASVGGYRALNETWLVSLLGGASPEVVHGLMLCSVLGGVLVTVGLGGRATALFTLQMFLPLSRLNTHANGSYEHLLTNALWLLVITGATATWSADARLRTGSWGTGRPVPRWGRWLVLVQIVLVYGTTGLQKMGSSWTPLGGFKAVYYALRDPGWQRWDLPLLGWIEPLLAISTAGVWLFETSWLLVPLLLWWRLRDGSGGRLGGWVRLRDPRPGILLFGGVLHAGILLMMEVGAFSWLTMCFYVALWTPQEVSKALPRRLPWRSPSPEAPSPDPSASR